MIDPTGNSGECAAWSGSMWWLCGVDGPLPVGDIVYGAGAAGTAIYEYGPAVANWVGTYGPAAVDTVSMVGAGWKIRLAIFLVKIREGKKLKMLEKMTPMEIVVEHLKKRTNK